MIKYPPGSGRIFFIGMTGMPFGTAYTAKIKNKTGTSPIYCIDLQSRTWGGFYFGKYKHL